MPHTGHPRPGCAGGAGAAEWSQADAWREVARKMGMRLGGCPSGAARIRMDRSRANPLLCGVAAMKYRLAFLAFCAVMSVAAVAAPPPAPDLVVVGVAAASHGNVIARVHNQGNGPAAACKINL